MHVIYAMKFNHVIYDVVHILKGSHFSASLYTIRVLIVL